MGNYKKIILNINTKSPIQDCNHIMSFEGIDNQIERYTKKINEILEKLKDPNLSQDLRKRLELELAVATQERTKWKIRKNNLFTTRHKK